MNTKNLSQNLTGSIQRPGKLATSSRFGTYSKINSMSLLIVLLSNTMSMGAPVNTFNDITFWVGTGDHRAAMAVDWDHSSAADEALVWGYRWSGQATSEDMLRAVVQADSRLFLRHGSTSQFGLPIYGIGYDQNNDETFSITSNITFDAEGFAETSVPDPPPQQPAQSTDAADWYAEGFFTGFWHYAIGNDNPFDGGSWASSTIGLSSRQLTDGDWDGWTFEIPPTLISIAFPENPITAEAPFSADFDLDDDIDGTDFLTWQRGFGITENASLAQGDANGDGRVDGVDLQNWSSTYGSPNNLNVSIAIPEPSSLALIISTLTLLGTLLLNRCRTPWRCF